jgi:Protein of unknown function (DUF2397)
MTLPRGATDLFRHVSADKSPLYRVVIDIFAAARRQCRLQLRPDEVLSLAAELRLARNASRQSFE